MARTLSDRLAEAAQGAFVGRAGELRALQEAVRAPDPPFAVAHIYGPGGIGKSALLRALFDSLPPDYLQIRLDCREVEPTAEGALSAIAATIGGGVAADLTEISEYLGREARRVIVAFDTYETFGLLDTWLRQTLMPALPDSAITLIASREPPSPGWSTSPGWSGMFREIELEGLDESQSLAMLQSRGLSEAQARRINEFTRGHPLALELAAAAGRAHPDLQIEKAAIPRVVARLTEMLLTGIDQKTVDALEAGAMVRRITEPLLAALLRTDSARAQFDALRQLPFVSAVRDGLILHDLMRDTISYGLAQRDPNKYITYRLRAWRYLNEISHRSEKSSLWQYTADLLYLVQNPNVRNAFFRPSAIEVAIEPATLADREAIAQICASFEPAASAEWLMRWFDRHPETFLVGRTSSEPVAGFYIICEHDQVDAALLRSDPITSAWMTHLDEHPVDPDERVLFCRRWLSRANGEAPGPIQVAFWVDIKRLYLELRPNLRRIYCPVIDLGAYAAIVAPLGFTPIEKAQRQLDGITYHSAVLDFGPASIDGWLRRLIGVEIAAEDGAGMADDTVLRTVLFTDIVGHTEMMQRLGDVKGRAVLREHDRITRQTLNRYGGAEVKTIGDGFMASFTSVSSALDCAITLQRAFTAPVIASGVPEPIAIRVGLNTGEPIEEAGDLFGSTVILASRIAAQAGAGEILLPEAVRHLVAGKSFAFDDRGDHAMKGFADRVRLYAAQWRE